MNRLLILSLILIGCKPKPNLDIISTLKETVIANENENYRIVRLIEKETIERGNDFEDSVFLNNVNSILQTRQKLVSEGALDKYFDFITNKYKQMFNREPFLDEYDTLKMNRTNKIKSLFQYQKDSVTYYTYLINLLILENEVLEYSAIQLSSCRFYSSYAYISKCTDSVKLGEEYSFAVVPDVYCPNESELIIDTSLTIHRNNKNTSLSCKIEKVGGVIAIKTRPIEEGEYIINGKFLLKNKKLNFVLSKKYIVKFYVKNYKHYLTGSSLQIGARKSSLLI
jgi:hypothetical protein